MAASVVYYGDEQMELPPGFRFHPTDEELISHYLYPKVFDPGFSARAIGDVDLNKVEPWELPWKAKLGEKEWYFFCVRDRKYPTGMRTNRATEAGYWKATGKDKEIYRAKTLVGMKKTLVFYRGRAPKGEKTNWVMHEYRLDGKFSIQNLPKSAKGEWVISRVFQKTAGGKKIPITGLAMVGGYGGGGFEASNLPPLMDISSMEMDGQTTNGETSHVTCFSESMADQKHREDHVVESFNNNNHTDSSLVPNPSQMVPNTEYQDSMWMQDPAILRLLYDNNEPNSRPYPKTELTHDTGMITSSGVSNNDLGQRIGHFADQDYGFNLGGSVDMDSLWNY